MSVSQVADEVIYTGLMKPHEEGHWHRFRQATGYAFQLRRRVLNCWWMTKKSLVDWQIIDPLPFRHGAIAAFMPVWLPRPLKDAISRSFNMNVLPVGQT